MSGLRCLAVDADEPALAELSYLLRNSALVDSVETHTSLEQAVTHAQSVDVIFVCLIHHSPSDINDTFQSKDNGPLFVALARNEDLAIEAYGVGAVDFMIKPLTAQAIEKTLQRVESLLAPKASTPEKRITCELNGALHLIDIRDILFIRSNGDYSLVTTPSGEYVSRASLAHLADTYESDGFIRVHRQWIVPISRVDALLVEETQNFALVHGHQVPVARRCVRSVRDLLR